MTKVAGMIRITGIAMVTLVTRMTRVGGILGECLYDWDTQDDWNDWDTCGDQDGKVDYDEPAIRG